ncbi:MAG: hypothetical protein HOC74_09970 [Gemmatimonadetes bacterium]|nr:hypothetical protein [Gemmatimonadota bacterium]
MRWFFLAAVLFTAHGALGHVGDRIYPFFEITDEQLAEIDLHDGSVEDWETIFGEPSLTPLDFSIYTKPGAQYDPSDFGYRIWLGWNDSTNRIYIALEMVDDLYVNQYDPDKQLASSMGHHDSSLTFLIDGDHSGGQYHSGMTAEASYPLGETREERERLVDQQAQEYTAIAEVPRGSKVQLGRSHGDWYSSPPYADGGGTSFGESPTVSVTEFYVTPFDHLVKDNPEDSIVSELFPGKTIGFQIQLVDIDNEGRFSGNTLTHDIDSSYNLPGEGLFVFFADFFVDGVLIGIGKESVVQSSTWGQIKASFR